MDFSELIHNPYAVGALSFLAGITGTVITTQITGRRAVFRYFVVHNAIGRTVNDPVFGSVQVTWNNNAIAHLYLSTVELANDSFRDFENVVVMIYTTNTKLLSQFPSIIGTPRIAQLTDDYKTRIQVPEGQQPTADQFDTWHRGRDFVLPTFNRGQKVRFEFLNSADTADMPAIYLSVSHPGARVRFHVAAETFWGVPRPRAALAGTLVGAAVLTVMLALVGPAWVIGLSAFVLGLFAQMPGAAVVRAWRALRGWYGG
jgi:hypothetical protein